MSLILSIYWAHAFLWVLSHLVLKAIAIRYYLLSIILRMKKKEKIPWRLEVLMTNPTAQVVNGIVETWSRSAYTYVFTSALFRVCESESEVAQSCPTFSDPMDYSPPGPPSMGFSRQEYWSGVPLPSPLTAARHIIFTWSWYTWWQP